MKIEFIHEKGVGILNEDSFLIKDNIFGVFDGVTSINKASMVEGKTGGLIASTITKDIFSKNNKSLKELAVEANEKIGEEMKKMEIDTTDKLNLWCTNLAVVKIINNNNLDWIQLSDSFIALIYQDNTFKIISENDNHDEETLSMWAELAKDKTENIRGVLDEQFKKVRRNSNTTYGLLTGEKEAINFLREGTEDLKKVKNILLFTDGFLIPQKDISKPYPWDFFINLYLKEGLEGIKNYIRKIEKNDKKCWVYPRSKQHDDMTAISITL